MMHMSPGGLLKLEAREAVELKAYRDVRGIPTIGVGHTSMAGPPRVTIPMVITRDEALKILARDLGQYEDAVNHAIKKPMTQNQFDAMTSLAYNIGAGGFIGSAAAHFFNEGNIEAAANAFLKWEHPASLVERREGERKQFLS